MRNMSSTLTSQNKKILAENDKQYECNCRNKDECPLENKCYELFMRQMSSP